MIIKDFKKGDLIIVTSERQKQFSDIASSKWASIYERDIEYSEAIDVHYNNMIAIGLQISKERVADIITPNAKYFLTTTGEVLSYDNHEKADIFDEKYIINNIAIDEVSSEKDKYISHHTVDADEDNIYRVHTLDTIRMRIIKDFDNRGARCCYTAQRFNKESNKWEFIDKMTYMTGDQVPAWHPTREEVVETLPYHDLLEEDVIFGEEPERIAERKAQEEERLKKKEEENFKEFIQNINNYKADIVINIDNKEYNINEIINKGKKIYISIK